MAEKQFKICLRIRGPTFIVETIDAVDAGTLVVTTKEKEVLGIFDLVGKKQADGFKRLFASINIIPEEEIVRLWWKSTVFKQPQQIGILAVYVSCTANIEKCRIMWI